MSIRQFITILEAQCYLIMMQNNSHSRREMIKKTLAISTLIAGLPQLATAGSSAISEEEGKNYTFLFQGDSITDGNRSRNNDWNHVLGHGYAYLIASRLWYDHPARGFHFFNRGISGNKVSDLAARWQPDTLDIKPDLLSILVGVNDLNGAVSATDYEEGYRALLTQTKEKLPGTKLVLCEPFLLPVGKMKEDWAAKSADMKSRQEIAKRLALESGAIFVGLQEDFNKACSRAPADYWIWDGIHPMPGGHELIARKWIHTVGKELHFIR